MLERAENAPVDWSEEHTQAAVRDTVLDLSPDLVLFQELPGVVPYVETHDMVKANPMSHSGNLATLIGHHLADEEVHIGVVPGCGLLVTFVERDLTVANVHLAPGAAGAQDRARQLRAILESAPTSDVLIAGDTNTRLNEEPELGALGLWGERPPEPTWNGRKNRFRGASGDFLAYFSRYFATGDIDVTEVVVHSDRGITVDGATFEISDHYGFSGTVITKP